MYYFKFYNKVWKLRFTNCKHSFLSLFYYVLFTFHLLVIRRVKLNSTLIYEILSFSLYLLHHYTV